MRVGEPYILDTGAGRQKGRGRRRRQAGGRRRQRGHGVISGLLEVVKNIALPIAKRAGKSLLKQGIKQAPRLVMNRNKSTALNIGKTVGKKILSQVVQDIGSSVGTKVRKGRRQKRVGVNRRARSSRSVH